MSKQPKREGARVKWTPWFATDLERELYKALVAFAKHFGPLEDNEMLHKDARRCFRLARAALAKARGETP